MRINEGAELIPCPQFKCSITVDHDTITHVITDEKIKERYKQLTTVSFVRVCGKKISLFGVIFLVKLSNFILIDVFVLIYLSNRMIHFWNGAPVPIVIMQLKHH